MKKLVGIASIPSRENGLKEVIKNLSPQVDHIYVWLNGYKDIPKIDKKNVTFHLSKENVGALAKMKILSLIDEKDFYYFTCDDDIIYPPNYVEYNLSLYEPGSIQSSHAKKYLSFPIKSYSSPDRISYYFGSRIKKKDKVHIIGTGVCLMDSKTAFNINYNDFSTSNMLDVWVSCWAHSNKVPMYIIPHEGGWLSQNPSVSQINCIWHQAQSSDIIQTQIINSYFT